MSAPRALPRIGHVVPPVRDVAAMQAFSCAAPGCTVERRQQEIGLLQLPAGDALIDLGDVAGTLGRAGGAAPAAGGRTMDHRCLRVAPFNGEAIAMHLHVHVHGVRLSAFGARCGADGEESSQHGVDPAGSMVVPQCPPDRPA